VGLQRRLYPDSNKDGTLRITLGRRPSLQIGLASSLDSEAWFGWHTTLLLKPLPIINVELNTMPLPGGFSGKLTLTKSFLQQSASVLGMWKSPRGVIVAIGTTLSSATVIDPNGNVTSQGTVSGHLM